MKCSKLLTIAALTVSATFTLTAQAADNTNHQQKVQQLQQSKNPNQLIVDTLFSNASPTEKAKLQEQIKKYSQVQYGFGDATANPSPKKDGDIEKNIKSHSPETVKSQMKVMREAAQELPRLDKISPKKTTP